MSSASNNPRIGEINGTQIAPGQSTFQTDDQAHLLDKEWASSAFMVGSSGITDEDDVKNRYYSSAHVKFTDSRLGCNIGINPRPQFCHYSDVVVKGRLNRTKPSLTAVSGNYGMGRQYSEFIDDPAQRIYMRFGVPQFNSLVGFLQTAYETNQMSLARTGRAKSIFYKGGTLLGSAALLSSFPIVAIAIYTTKLVNFFINRPTSKFYTMKETMHLYWSSVNQLVNSMAINRGILPSYLDPSAEAANGQRLGRPQKLDEQYLDTIASLMPDVFGRSTGGVFYFDVFSMANRAQIIATRLIREEYENLEQGSATDFYGFLKKTISGTGSHGSQVMEADGTASASATLDHYVSLSKVLEEFCEVVSSVKTFLLEDEEKGDGVEVNLRAEKERKEAEAPGFAEQVDAKLRDGGMFASFIVDHTGPQGESWSNAVTESELSRKLNGIVSDMAGARFTFAEGNILGGIPGDIVGAVLGAVRDTATGVLNGITAGLSQVVEGLAGAGYIDIPKHWQSSSYIAAKATYTMQLISPYGNSISQLMNIDIPLAMILAGALPRSTGRASYTAPFLCQIYDRGRCQHRLAMIEQLSITRGQSHLAYGDSGNALQVDVSFSVTDLSSIMHMPIASGLLGDVDIAQDEDNVMVDFLAVLAGRSIESQIYPWPRARIRYANLLASTGKLTSSAYWASVATNNSVAEMVRFFTRSTSLINVTGEGGGA